jgi:Gluconate 2-dehydrogenase subunit 3
MTDAFESPHPGYDILDKWDAPSFNPITRQVLRERLTRVPQRRFLDPDAYALLEAVCQRLIPQPERAEPVPIAPWIDQTLARNRTDGTRYADVPQQREGWPMALAAIDAEADARFGAGFRQLDPARQDAVLRAITAGEAGGPHWQGIPPQRHFREVMLKEVVAVYYAHPAALSEIGFGGPAAPRGYVGLGAGRIDPCEAPERRR